MKRMVMVLVALGWLVWVGTARAQTVGVSAVLENRLAVLAHGYGGKEGFLYLEDANLNFCGGWISLLLTRNANGLPVRADGQALGALWTNGGAFLGFSSGSVSFTLSGISVQWAGVSGVFAVVKPWVVSLTR